VAVAVQMQREALELLVELVPVILAVQEALVRRHLSLAHL
jgi:hypothetical protein